MDGEDEQGCTLPNSCQEWWDAGYHNSGVYTICEFINNASPTVYKEAFMLPLQHYVLLMVGGL